jgi:hypothetical protein
MMRTILIVLLSVHGLIHLLGFFKAFNILEIRELTMPISKPFGVLWLLAAFLMIATVISLGFKSPYWWVFGIVALLVSQYIVMYFWADAKFATAVNVVLLIAIVMGFASWKFERKYISDVQAGLKRASELQPTILTERDITDLPKAVQNYLHYVGALNKPKVYNFHAVFEAEMRGKNQDWFTLSAEQYNFFDTFERLFFLDAKVKGLPTRGYHRYKDNASGMTIKLLSLIPVVEVSGEKMFEAETVTLFNDMCFLAPATLIDKNIRWEPIDDASTRAFFTNGNVTISAVLHFNEKGQLVNFVSDDRYDINEMQKYRFSTPLSKYKTINGYTMPTYGEAIWHYRDGPFVYGKFSLKTIRYNVGGLD